MGKPFYRTFRYAILILFNTDKDISSSCIFQIGRKSTDGMDKFCQDSTRT